MLESNTPAHVFRFMSLRPPRPLTTKAGWALPKTDLVERMVDADSADRARIAESAMANRPEVAVPFDGLAVWAKVRTAADGAADFDGFRDALEQAAVDPDALEADARRLGDAIAVRWYGRLEAAQLNLLPALERALGLYTLASVPRDSVPDGGARLVDLLPQGFVLTTRPGAAPKAGILLDDRTKESKQGKDCPPERGTYLQPAAAEPAAKGLPETATGGDGRGVARVKLALIGQAAAELGAYDPDLAVDEGALRGGPLAALSPETKAIVAGALGGDATTVSAIQSSLEMQAMVQAQMVAAAPVAAQKPVDVAVPAFSGRVRPAGVADLLVVKQQILRYESSEIAHVENVMPGETRERTHRMLERTEEIFTRETEVTTETQRELETSERFELNSEVSKTIKEDLSLGLDLSVSGKYGPSVEFSSNFEFDFERSEERSQQTSSTFARDVMSRSLEKVVERVREERVRRVLREVEEINLHRFENATADPIVGIYQFLDKIYVNRIFNYGKRLMFDFMIPEPASYLWHLEDNPSSLSELPTPPEPLGISSALGINVGNYAMLAARYGATGVEPPPPLAVTVAGGHTQKEGGDEGGEPRSAHEISLQIPDGYRPVTVRGRVQALTDDRLSLYLGAGDNGARFVEVRGQDVTDGHYIYDGTFSFSAPSNALADGKLTVQVLAWETNHFTVSVEVQCRRTLAHFNSWMHETYDVILAAYRDALREWEQKMERLRDEEEQRRAESEGRSFGDSPLANRKVMLTELKKHAISILTRQRYEHTAAVRDGDPPWFDFDEAAFKGSFIRFFEQAFEWDQMQYVFYPYYWTRYERWASLAQHRDVDPLFQQFLQAGEARVVAPVRPGFERAITYFLETGRLWEGRGEPPVIGSDLYVSIITEIEERTGRSKGEIPVGETWESRLPTPLVILRRADPLPEWENRAPHGWDWRPAN